MTKKQKRQGLFFCTKNVRYLRFIFIAGLFILCISCDKNKEESKEVGINEVLEEQKKQAINFPKTIVNLSPLAKDEAEEWDLYIAMESEVKRMKEYNIQDAMASSFTILQAADTLQKTIPKRFRLLPIESRIQVLHAKASVLHQLSKKQLPDIEKIKQTAEEIPIDFYNLNIQINEVFLETPKFD